MYSRNTPLSLSEKEEIKRVYLEIGNQQKVAKITKHSSSTVWKVLKSYGLNKGQGGNQHYSITDEQILKGIADGLTRQEIADKYGTHVENLARRMHKLGVHATYAPSGGSRKIFGECWHYTPGKDDLIKNKYPSFIYLESQKKGSSKRIRLKCKKCGNIIERAESTIRQKNIVCEHCERARQEQIDLQNERIKLMRFFYALAESKKPKKCIICGSEFYSQYSNARYCSKSCKRKNHSGGKSIRHRCCKYGVLYDPSVKPIKIFKRDGYVCQICGKPCDSNDKGWGNFGPYAPTVDHILALANGGAHIWSNVQCAHAICNSYKRDLITV